MADEAPPKPPRRRVVVVSVVAALVVVLGTLAADRVAASVVGGRIAAQLGCRAGAGAKPTVRVDGFPVLTQLAGGKLTRVDAHLDRWTTQDGAVTDVSVTARGVPISAGSGPRDFSAIDVTASVPYALLPAVVDGLPVTYAAADGGLLSITATVSLVGAALPVTVLARPTVVGGRLVVVPQEVQALGLRQPAEVFKDQIAKFVPARELPPLPYGLQYRSITAKATGLQVVIGATDVTVTPGGTTGSSTPCE